MTILVTGGAGFIASHTNVELLNEGYDVIVMDNLCNSSRESIARVEAITGKKIKFYETDMRDLEGLENIFKENHIDVIIHFAGLKAVGESCEKPYEYYDNNITGTLNIIKMMKKSEKNGDVLMTGGGALNIGLRKAFEDELIRDVFVANHPQFNGAIGAALLASERG